MEQYILTKGDNNNADDVGLYNGVQYLQKKDIIGKVQALVLHFFFSSCLRVFRRRWI